MNILSALQAGHAPEKILKYISKVDPDLALKINTGLQAGHSIEKMLNYLSQMGNKVSSLLGKGQKQSSNIYKNAQQSIHPFITGAAQGAGILGAGALGAYALGRAVPQAAQVLQGELLPAMSEGPLQIGMQQAPQQITQQQQQLPFIQGQAQKITPPAPPAEPIQTKAPIPQQAPQVPQVIPLPKDFEEMTKNMLKTGNNADQIAGAFKHFYPDMVKKYEKATNIPIRSAIEEFSKSLPEKEEPKISPPLQQTVNKPEINEISKPIEEEKPKETKKGSKVALPNGDIGEITNIRQGIATVNSNGKEYRRKLDELIESPIPEKDLAELHDELMKGIEKKTGQEISRMVNWAGYDPKTNELAFVPHVGALYVYDDISPDDAKELTNLLTQRKTSGENFIGAWGQGTQSPIGAAMSKLIQKLQKERGGKGSEYKGKYEKIYDAIEPAKVASKQKFEEKQAVNREEKKSEKERKNKEKADVKKRKAKKPRSD